MAHTMTDSQEDLYQCVGICMVDPDSGYCLGCGRPPMDEPAIVAEAVEAVTIAKNIPTEADQPE
jgi:uncharacterized protein